MGRYRKGDEPLTVERVRKGTMRFRPGFNMEVACFLMVMSKRYGERAEHNEELFKATGDWSKRIRATRLKRLQSHCVSLACATNGTWSSTDWNEFMTLLHKSHEGK